ncbi:Membrane protein GlpM [Thiomonas sp. X19]|nr:Membrane protein GlpM [Thiomonas sp. X19]
MGARTIAPMLTLALKAALGAAAALLIAVLAASRNYVIAGLVPLFPTFALVAHVLVGREHGPAALRATVVFGLWAMLPYAAYLLAVYALADRLPLGWALASATLLWLLAAGVLILAWSRLHAG